MKRILNLKRDENDYRDYKFHKLVPIKPKIELPKTFNLSIYTSLPEILDQGDLGSCTANAASNSLKYILKKNKKVVFQPSRLFIYWFTRFIQKTVNIDSGASNRDTLKSIHRNGVCNEVNWVYNVGRFKVKPNNNAVRLAVKHKLGFQYLSVNQDINIMKNCIFQGFPIIVGIEVYSSFMSPVVSSTGDIPIPDTKKEEYLGGHAVWIVSYDDNTRKFGLMNSWGPGWGNKGMFTLPYDYLLNKDLAYDFWTVKVFN